jgi:hypothetical protein
MTEATDAEKIAAIIARSKIPAQTFLDAINSKQVEFEAVAEPADGLAFVTRIVDSPCQLSGVLGLDGVWRISSFSIPTALEHENAAEVAAAEALDDDAFVLVDGPVAERMVRDAIPKILAHLTHREMRAISEQRLAQSRFAVRSLH